MHHLMSILVATSFLGCSSPSVRAPQQSKESSTQSVNIPAALKEGPTAAESSFQTLMGVTGNGEKSRAVAKFLNRQRDFYFIAHGLLNNFDAELDKLIEMKKMAPLTVSDFETVDRLQFQLRIAWEFSERNLHEILDIYELALRNANDPSAEFHQASLWIVENIAGWLKAGAKKGDSSAIISLAQNLDDVNYQVRESLATRGKKIIRIPSFAKFYLLSAEAYKAAHAQSLKFAKLRQPTLLDSFIGREWLRYKADRESESLNELKNWQDSETAAERRPQALDTLYPDAGAPGQVTGNRFPENTWAITLDDGPHPTHTQAMFDVLRQAGITGTFFWQTKNLLAYPNFSARARELGFHRANHSYTHANLPKLGQAGLNHEINDAFDDFQKIVGAQPTLFRCPYGACGASGSTIRQMIAAKNALHISWNVDTLDWQDKNAQSIFERTRKQIDLRRHGIMLLHDIHPQSVVALKLIANYLREKKYSVKALPEIISLVREKPYASP